MSDTISAVDAGWLLGAGFELSSLATIKPAVELRYQRGFRNLLPAGPGEVNQQTVSCLVSITYGGSSPADPQESVPDALYGSHDERATKTPSTKRVTSVVMGRPGDCWLDTMRFTRIARASRDGQYGYEVSYDIAGHGQVVLFWPRARIDFDGRPRDSLLATMTLRKGRLRYPRRITSKSLPEVHQGILQLEAAYAKQADGATSAMEGFAIVAGLGGLKPTLRTIPKTPPRSAAPRGANSAVRPSSTGTAARGASSFGPRSLGAAQVRILQSGGNKIASGTAKALNEVAGRNLTRREWGRVLEALKQDAGLPPGHHGKITSTGDYLDKAGNFIGSLFEYLP